MDKALDRVAAMYSENLRRHGAGPQSVGWRDDVGQQLRFDRLARVIDADSVLEGFTVNDLGCGYGAMFGWLEARFGHGLRAFHGYDLSSEMIGEATRRVPDARARFHLSSSLTVEADFTFASGIFNVPMGADGSVWREHMERTISAMAKASRKGFAFNVLTTYVDWKAPNLHYADPAEWFNLIRRDVAKYVTLHHDYPLYEWTITARKVP